MSSLIKVFFGQIDKERILEKEALEVSFWGSEDYFLELEEPVSWTHGVFQFFQSSDEEFWWTIDGKFQRFSGEFERIKRFLGSSFVDFNLFYDLLETLSIAEADLFDVKDEFENDNIIIEGVEDSEIIDLSSLFYNFESDDYSSIWVFEVSAYTVPKHDVKEDEIFLDYDSTDDLELKNRFIFYVAERS